MTWAKKLDLNGRVISLSMYLIVNRKEGVRAYFCISSISISVKSIVKFYFKPLTCRFYHSPNDFKAPLISDCRIPKG